MAEDKSTVEAPDLFQKVKDWHSAGRKHQKEWQAEARECYDFVAGRQWSTDDLQKLEDQNRPQITFNRIGPVVESVAGTEVNNRQEVRYIPRTMGVVQINEILTSAAKWVRDECDAEDEESHSFLDTVTCGMGWTETRLETDQDLSGKIEIPRVDPLEMMWDPAARKQNIVDKRWVMRIKDVQKDDAQTLFPDAEEEDLHAGWAMEPAGDEPHDATQAPFYKEDQSGGATKDTKKKVRLVEVQWWEHKPYQLIIDPFNGEKKEMSEGDHKQLVKRVAEINKEQGAEFKVESIKVRRRVYKRAFVGAKVLEEGDCPCPTEFTYQAITGKLDRNKGLWYGVVRALKDPQRWANKWLSQSMYILNTNAKGGLLAETDAFVNTRKAEEEWADPSAITWVKSGGLAKIKEKTMYAFPAGFDKLMQFAITSIPDVSGINLNFMALTKGDEAAILDRQRKQTALTILAGLFNNLRRYRKEQGRVLLYYIITYISDGRLIRITEGENQKYIPLLRQPEMSHYDVIVDDNPTSPSQKERTWSIILQLMPILQRMPLPPTIWSQIIKQSPLPNSFVEPIMKLAEQPPKPPQLTPEQQGKVQKLNAEVQKIQAQIDKLAAETEKINVEAGVRAVEVEPYEPPQPEYPVAMQ